MRILVAEPIAREGVELLRARHEVDERVGLGPTSTRRSCPTTTRSSSAARSRSTPSSSRPGTRLVVIGRAGVGVDNVDLDAATRAGIVVVNAPTGNTIAAAEHTLALLYAVARRVAAADASLRRGEWKRSQFTGVELRGRTLGIVGLGKIGQAIAARARAMEMTVLAVDPFVSAEQAAHHGVELVELAGPPRAIRRDHPPRPAQPDDARAHRGPRAGPDEARRDPPQRRPGRDRRRGGAWPSALPRAGSAAPAIDVFEHEPPTGSPLLDAPNTVLTPHLGASTAEAQVLVAEEVADQILDVLDGRPARYAVNAPLLTPETARAIAPYLPLAEMLGRFFAQFARTGVKTLTLEVAGELAAFDVSPLTAGGAPRPARDGHDRAGEPRQRRRRWPGPAGSPSSSARRPRPASSPRS